jgi:hypothetical protein
MKLQGMQVDELRGLGLDIHDICIHQERIQTIMNRRDELFIPIVDTCRFDNQGILPQTFVREVNRDMLSGFVAFVPAAGAASRYFKPLHELRQAIWIRDDSVIADQCQKLLQQGALEWPLPDPLMQLLKQAAAGQQLEISQQVLLDAIDSPKALLPCWPGGPTFMQMKAEEHSKLRGLDAEVYVAPLGQTELFRRHIEGRIEDKKRPVHFLEQGTTMSTLRFRTDGLPFRDREQQLSLVPAGHGMLVKLFPEIKRSCPDAHSLFIRNIDNVNGSRPEILAATESFLLQHQTILQALTLIRKALHQDEITEAARVAQNLLNQVVSLRPLPPQAWIREWAEPWRPLWSVLLQIFHCPVSYAERQRLLHQDKRAIRQLFDRPLNTLGQVPNLGKDVGGTPVFAQSSSGDVTICLELPHVSGVDRQRFLENSRLATHFNPVFVAAEIPAQHHAYDLENCPFWILAEKSFHGEQVVYHETVLYEILGNSITCNVLFPEIPRSLFNPHKTLLDGLKASV